MTPLHALDWSTDVRTGKPEKYTVSIDDPQNRFRLFLSGWQDSLSPRKWKSRVVTWRNLGRAFGSVLGDVESDHRKALYAMLLHQFVSGVRCRRWTEEEKMAAFDYFGLTVADPESDG